MIFSETPDLTIAPTRSLPAFDVSNDVFQASNMMADKFVIMRIANLRIGRTTFYQKIRIDGDQLIWPQQSSWSNKVTIGSSGRFKEAMALSREWRPRKKGSFFQ